MICRFTSRPRPRSRWPIVVLAALLPVSVFAAPDVWVLLVVARDATITEFALDNGLPESPRGFDALPADSVVRRCEPVGIESDAADRRVLCRETDAAAAWFVSVHGDWNTLQDEIDASIRAGNRPVDISRDAAALTVVWTRAEGIGMDWRLSSCEASAPVLTRAVHLYGDKGYRLAGISGHDGLFWLLFERPPDGRRSSAVVSVRVADVEPAEAHDRVSRTVESARASGWELAGLASTDDALHFAVVPVAPR